MPFFVYCLENGTNKVTLIDKFEDPNSKVEKIKEAAISFIKNEHGEKRAENPFRDGILDYKLTEDGYFLRHVEGNSSNMDIDVFQRKINITPGKIWGNYLDVTVKKIYTFSVTEYDNTNNNQIKKISTNNVTKNLLLPTKQLFLEELRKKIKKREQKQINN